MRLALVSMKGKMGEICANALCNNIQNRTELIRAPVKSERKQDARPDPSIKRPIGV